ncbi:MAG: transglutaminase family protein [Burkholderiaceae bacterium]|nr:MAG: transglutaminase family protein [Burkholderiaceae bacterium]
MMQIALTHRTRYQFDRSVRIGPHAVRLYPAPHCRTPILSYALNVEPHADTILWHTDSDGNTVVNMTFATAATALQIDVKLVADLSPLNPFEFQIGPQAHTWPFQYGPDAAHDMVAFLAHDPESAALHEFLAPFRQQRNQAPIPTIDLLVRLNQHVFTHTHYNTRMLPGVQSPEETLALKSGSCRDSAWLLVHCLRQLGIAARFASGYLIEIKWGQTPFNSAVNSGHADLHAWAEAWIPGAGWIGLDATSGLLAGEGHIPLACGAIPCKAAPIAGSTEPCQVDFSFAMDVTQI